MKKGLKIFLGIIILLVICYLAIFITNYIRCSNFKIPIFSIKQEKQGETTIYYCIGYEVKKEETKVEMYMFNKLIAATVAQINSQKENNIVKINDGKIENELLIDDFIDKKTNELSISEIDSNGKNNLIKLEYVSGKNENSSYSINVTINESVPAEREDFKYKLSINGEEKGTYDALNWSVKRETVDNTVRLTFYTYQDVIEFPVICTYNLDSSNYKKKFELNYYQRKDLGVEDITEEIHTFGGDVEITIEGDMVYSLSDALKEKIITEEDILEQAKIDSQYGICENAMYLDGGSVEYRYPEYTILKCNTLNGNKNLYIGMRGEIINQLNI